MTDALSVSGVTLSSGGLIALHRLAQETGSAKVFAALPGGFATRRKGQGLDVADTRAYVAGDDIRHLDRGTTARTGTLHVRQFQQERDRITLLIADFRPAMFWGIRRAFRSVAAAEALALIGWKVVESGGRVGLLSLGPDGPLVVPPRGRTRGMLDVIGGLVEAHEKALRSIAGGIRDDPALDAGLGRVTRLVPSGAELVIASGFDVPGPGLADKLDSFSRRHFPRLVAVTDGAAQNLPRGRYPVRLPDGQRMRIALSSDTRDIPDHVHHSIAGRPALIVDAGQPVEEMARRLAAGFLQESAA